MTQISLVQKDSNDENRLKNYFDLRIQPECAICQQPLEIRAYSRNFAHIKIYPCERCSNIKSEDTNLKYWLDRARAADKKARDEDRQAEKEALERMESKIYKQFEDRFKRLMREAAVKNASEKESTNARKKSKNPKR